MLIRIKLGKSPDFCTSKARCCNNAQRRNPPNLTVNLWGGLLDKRCLLHCLLHCVTVSNLKGSLLRRKKLLFFIFYEQMVEGINKILNGQAKDTGWEREV